MSDSVHPRISVSGISSWNQSIAEDLALYAELGVHTIGVPMRKVQSDDDITRIRSGAVRVGNVIGLGQLGVPRAVAVAEQLDAPVVIFTTGPVGGLEWNDAADQLESALRPLVPAAVTLCLEHTNSLRVDVSFVHALRDAIDLARRLDIHVCMEVNACWAERNLARTIAEGVDRIGIVQISDYAVGTLSTPNRLVPGDGDIPLSRVIGQVLAAGYDGMFDLELIGPRIEEEGYASAITRSCAYLGDLLG